MPGCPPRHVCVAERRLLLTYLLTSVVVNGSSCCYDVSVKHFNSVCSLTLGNPIERSRRDVWTRPSTPSTVDRGSKLKRLGLGKREEMREARRSQCGAAPLWALRSRARRYESVTSSNEKLRRVPGHHAGRTTRRVASWVRCACCKRAS